MTARRALLDGLARDADIFEVLNGLGPLHPRNDTFPGEVFLDLAADALEWCVASRAEPLPLEGLRERFLPEVTLRGRQNAKLQYAVLAAAGVHGGTEPDLLDEVASWQTDDFWHYAMYAAVADLSRVDFLDSTGLGVLVSGLKRLREHDGSLTPVISTTRILRILEVTGLTTVFPSSPQSQPRSPQTRTGGRSSRAKPEAPRNGAGSTASRETTSHRARQASKPTSQEPDRTGRNHDRRHPPILKGRACRSTRSVRRSPTDGTKAGTAVPSHALRG